jgi:uncharacterized protein
VLLAVLLGSVTAAGADVAVPPVARVTDLTGTLGAEQRSTLSQRLADFQQANGAQVAVLMLPSTQPETIEQYGIRVAEAWKLGKKGVDDGLILLVAKDDHRLRIEVGYGLEGVIPDVVARRIIDETITPAFKAGDFYGGISAGVDRIIRTIQPDNEAAAPAETAAEEQARLQQQEEFERRFAEAEETSRRHAEQSQKIDMALLSLFLAFPLLIAGMVLRLWLSPAGSALPVAAAAGGLGAILTGWPVFGGILGASSFLLYWLIGRRVDPRKAGRRGGRSSGSGFDSSDSFSSSSSSGSDDSSSGGGGSFGGGGASGDW